MNYEIIICIGLIIFIIIIYKLHCDSVIINEKFSSEAEVKKIDDNVNIQMHIKKDHNLDDVESKNLEVLDKPKIWMYWQTLPGKKKPGYIDLCYESVKHNCSKCFNIILLDNNTIKNYLPDIDKISLDKLNLPQKVDYYRYSLLEKYGGVWLDADILVLKCICPYYKKLDQNDYVGFGCGFSVKDCGKKLNGYSRPLNWFMISKPDTDYIKCIKDEAHKKISNNTRISYHGIGKDLLNKCFEKLKKEKDWKYHHVDSKCQEYDSKGNKLYNILNNFEIKECEDERIFFPLYNTAPGYPDWFKNLTFDDFLKKEQPIKPLIDKAFSKKMGCI